MIFMSHTKTDRCRNYCIQEMSHFGLEASQVHTILFWQRLGLTNFELRIGLITEMGVKGFFLAKF